MKILYVNVTYNKGSTGKIVHDLFNYVKSQGHEAVVCYGRGIKVDYPNIHKISSNFEVYLHALLTRITGLTGYFSWFATKKLLRVMREFQPDVVHLHNLHGYYINPLPVINYLKRNSIKCVWTMHDEWLYTGKCGYSYECEMWKEKCGKCPYKSDYPSSLLFDFTKKMLRDKKKAFAGLTNIQIVAPSQWLVDKTRQSFLGDKSISVIHNGIDTYIFRSYDVKTLREYYDIKDDKKIILHVTSMFEDERKGGGYVLELAGRMPSVQFFIIGNQRSIENLPSNVIAVGRTENQEELAKFYSMADLLVITSRNENFPTVCVESICCGTPVIGFDVGGSRETAPNEYGCFVPFGDMDALEKAAYAALGGEPYAKDGCVAFGRKIYDKSVMANKYLVCYFS